MIPVSFHRNIHFFHYIGTFISPVKHLKDTVQLCSVHLLSINSHKYDENLSVACKNPIFSCSIWFPFGKINAEISNQLLLLGLEISTS